MQQSYRAQPGSECRLRDLEQSCERCSARDFFRQTPTADYVCLPCDAPNRQVGIGIPDVIEVALSEHAGQESGLSAAFQIHYTIASVNAIEVPHVSRNCLSKALI